MKSVGQPTAAFFRSVGVGGAADKVFSPFHLDSSVGLSFELLRLDATVHVSPQSASTVRAPCPIATSASSSDNYPSSPKEFLLTLRGRDSCPDFSESNSLH